MRPAAFVLVVACGSPITNDPFLEEAVFQAALPLEARLAAPAKVLLAPNADNVVLAAAKRVAAEHELRVELPIAVGRRLRAVEPDVRSDLRRAWFNVELLANAAPSVLAPDADRFEAWIVAEVTRPLDGDFTMGITLAPGPDGPHTPVSAGTYDGIGQGTLVWDLAATATALGITPPEPLGQVLTEYDDATGQIDVITRSASGRPQALQLAGDESLTFETSLAITSDGRSHPAFVHVVHGDLGGWSVGVLDVDGEDATFSWCWDRWGTVVYQEGELGVPNQGLLTRCPEGALQWP